MNLAGVSRSLVVLDITGDYYIAWVLDTGWVTGYELRVIDCLMRNFSINCRSPLVIKCKRSGCLSMLVSLKRKQHIRNLSFKPKSSVIRICMKILTTVFSLGSLTCEFQIFYILLSVGGYPLYFYQKLSKLNFQQNYFFLN